MLSINLRGNDWALRIVVTWICRKICFMLFIFSFFDREFLLPVYNQPNNTVTILSRLHTRNVRNSFTEYFLVAYVHIHESSDTRVHRRYQRFTRRNIRTDDAQKEKREGGRAAAEREVDGGRGDGGGSSTSSTWRNEHIRVRSHTTCGETFQADRPGNLFLPEVAPFLYSSLSRTLREDPPSSVEFGVKRESCELLAWLILPAIFPRITRSLVVTASKFNVVID